MKNYSNSLEENPYENFAELIKRAEKIEDPLDYSKILVNLKVYISSFPSFEELTELYQDNFINKMSPMKVSPKKKWKLEETIIFSWVVSTYSLINNKCAEKLNREDWVNISKMFISMSPERCKFKWKSMQKSIVQTNQWSSEEDNFLSTIIQNKMKFKDSYKWTEIAHELNQKCNNEIVRLGKHCRERWYNHLDPYMKKGEWNLEEDLYILESILDSGKKWAHISKNLEGRTENAVKNRFITLVRHYNKMSGHKRKKEKTNPLDTPLDIIKQILNSLSRSPMLPDSPLKHKKLSDFDSPALKKEQYDSAYSSPMSEIGDEIDEEEEKQMKATTMEVEKPLIRLQQCKTLDSCASLFEENNKIFEENNKKSFESVDSDFKRINKMKSLETNLLLNQSPSNNNYSLSPENTNMINSKGVSPINFHNFMESNITLDSHLDISPPNFHYPAFSKISEKSQEDMNSLENINFSIENEKKAEIEQKKQNEIYKHTNSTPINNELNRSQWEKILHKLNSSSRNYLDLNNSNSLQILRTLNSFNSGRSKISLEHWNLENNINDSENMLPLLLQNELIKNHLRNFNDINTNMSNDSKKNNDEKSPIINSLNNLNLNGDSPKLLSPQIIKKNGNNLAFNKSISLEYNKYNHEDSLFTKKDSCSNFLNLEKTELMNSFLKNMEE